MASDTAGRSFTDRVRTLFNRSLSDSVVVEKEGRVLLNVPVLVVLVAAILAIWAVAILGIAALLFGYSIRIERGAEADNTPALLGGPTSETDGQPAPDDT